MKWNRTSMLLAIVIVLGLMISIVTVAQASHDRNRPDRAVSYINPDTGAATANPDVDPNSSCSSPDRSDNQQLSDPGTANRNVHNDACFFGGSRRGSYGSADVKVDGPATCEATGVGFISACPDPDNAGPQVAILRDTNGDGCNDRCFQIGYQAKGMAGDNEFYARLTTTAHQAHKKLSGVMTQLF